MYPAPFANGKVKPTRHVDFNAENLKNFKIYLEESMVLGYGLSKAGLT